jgi:hypothetical protein
MDFKHPRFGTKKFAIGSAILAVTLVGILTFSWSGTEMLLSKFSGADVTPSNASKLWTPSEGNTFRSSVSETYVGRTNEVVVRILAR